MLDSFSPSAAGIQTGYDEQSCKQINTCDSYTTAQHLQAERLINDLPEYIREDKLELYYQPQIDTRTGKTRSVEALVRWKHVIAGDIPPDIFIPLAEERGYIHELTEWVLNKALFQMRQWMNLDIHLNIAVNLSVHCFDDNTLPSKISDLLETWAVPAERLTLEITEGVMIRDTDRIIGILTELKNTGIGLSLDDFGSGYSSLSYLSNLPINELKIDRSLVMAMEQNSKNMTIVQSTIALARKLGMVVVAEGVENFRSYMNLLNFNCNTVQGYYFSAPVNLENFTDWLLDSDWGMQSGECALN